MAFMKESFKIVRTAIPGGIITGFLWIFVNRFVPQAGPGYLERQSWPLNNIYLCVAIGAVAAVGSAAIASWYKSRRRQAMEAAMALAGLRFRGTVDCNELQISGKLNILENWAEGSNYAVGQISQTEVQMVDVQTVRTSPTINSGGHEHGSQNSTATENQTVYLLPAGDRPFPSLSILRNRGPGWVSSLLGLQGIEFHAKNDAASEQDRATLEEFRKHYVVTQGPVLKSQRCPEDADEEATLFQELEQIISIPLLRNLLDHPEWSLEFCPSHIAIWKAKKCVKPGELAQQLNEVVELHRLVVDETLGYSNTMLEIRGSAKMEIDASVTEFVPLAIGGCVGMFLAFVLFIPVFFLLADTYPWVVFVWPVFGMGVMVISTLAASRLARRWKS